MTEPLDDARGELLACPLCQSNDLQIGSCYQEGSSERQAAVRCAKCGCRSTLLAWNTRAPLARCDAGFEIMSATQLAGYFKITETCAQQAIDDFGFIYRQRADTRPYSGPEFEPNGDLDEQGFALVPPPSEAGREDEPEIDLLAKRLAGAELNYRNAYERNNDHINTGRMWDKMRRAGDAIRQYFHEREESPDPGTVAVASTDRGSGQ